jgi:hypothetical protein
MVIDNNLCKVIKKNVFLSKINLKTFFNERENNYLRYC